MKHKIPALPYADGDEIANEVIDVFVELHPNVAMTFRQWSDLKECIQREIDGRYRDGGLISARDLIGDYKTSDFDV